MAEEEKVEQAESTKPETQAEQSNQDEQPSQVEQSNQAEEFIQGAQESSPGLLAEFWDFLLHNKKWWLTPILVVLLLMGLIIFLSGTVAAPFIYPLF